MAAPMWQYITILVFFSLGAVLNFISVGLMLFIEEMKPDALSFPQKEICAGGLLLKTLMAVFAGYLTWSLYQFAPGALSMGILIVHWASLAVGYIMSVKNAGKIKTYSYGQHIFGTLYCSAMLAALITYGVQCL